MKKLALTLVAVKRIVSDVPATEFNLSALKVAARTSLELGGFIHPPIVRRSGDVMNPSYEVIEGHFQIAAAKIAHEMDAIAGELIPVILVEAEMKSSAEKQLNAEPEPTAQPAPEPAPEPEIQPEPTPAPVLESAPEPTPEPTAEPAPAPAPKPPKKAVVTLIESSDKFKTLEKMTVKALKERCKALGLKGYSKLKKSELVACLTLSTVPTTTITQQAA